MNATLSLLLLLQGATPAQPRPMDYADIFRLATLGSAELSPDGRWVVYEVSRLQFPDWQRKTDLYLVSSDGRTTRQLTFTETEDETQPRWRPSLIAPQIGFVSSRDGKKRQLFLIQPDGGEARRITNADDGIGAWAWSRNGRWIAYLAGPEGKRQVWLLSGDGSGKAEQLTRHATGIASIAWSQDSRSVYFIAPEAPDSTHRRRVKEKFDVRMMNEPAGAEHLWAADVAAKAERRLTQGDFRVEDVELSRDGRWALLHANSLERYADNRAAELYLVQLDSARLERLTDNYVGEGNAAFSPDSRLIAFTADRDFKFGNLSRTFVRPVAGGAWRELGKSDTHDIGLSFWSGDSRTIYFNGDEGVNGDVYALDVTSGAARPVTRLTGSVSAAKSPELETALLRYTDPSAPTDLYLAPVAQIGNRGRWTRLTRLNPWVDSVALGRYETLRWKSGDGATVEGILVYPVGYDRTKRYPLIVQLHGGPASAYQNTFSGGYGTYTHVLAGKGYAVLQPNYRGSTGYGEAFQTAIAGNYWPLAETDILAGVDTVIARGVAAPDSLGMMGWSAGGHWSNWTLVTTDRFKAISSGAGVSNWISLYAQTDVQSTREYYLGGDASREGQNKPWDNYDHWWAESPLRYIARAKTPTLLHSGELDERIPMAQNLELYMALKKRGVPAEFFVYPGQPHGLQQPRYQLVKMVAELSWFEHWIRGRPWFSWEELLATADSIAGKAAVGNRSSVVSDR
jgi:dipeptidyl aminopeptidase/acylaminoacyl peptidase